MLKDGFTKKQVAVVIEKDSHSGKERITIVDTLEHAKWYTGSEVRQATLYVKEN